MQFPPMPRLVVTPLPRARPLSAGMYRECLDGVELNVGAEHIEAVRMCHSLTWLSPSSGSLPHLALSLIWLSHLARSPGQVRTCHSLGVVHEQQGRMAEAKHHYLRAIAGRERLQGPLNPATLKVRTRAPFPAAPGALCPCRPLTPHVVSVCVVYPGPRRFTTTRCSCSRAGSWTRPRTCT
jgi:hypothetical protein